VTGRSRDTLVVTPALVLSRVSYGEADLVVHLFTAERGRVATLARGARRSSKRFSGSIEPIHTLSVTLAERPQAELWPLRETSLSVPRLALTQNLEAMTRAGRALGWIRKASPARNPEPEAFVAITEFLDELDQSPELGQDDGCLAAFGMRLLSAFGWALELSRCVGCGTPCPEGKPAWINPERGGLVCRACGGGPILLGAALREALIQAGNGDSHRIPSADADQALRVIERALGAHLGIDDKRA